MRKLLLIILALSLNSCLTVRQIEKNCDKFAKVCITESVTVIEYRDTTIYLTDTIHVKLPPDTVTITNTVNIVNDKVFMNDIYKEFGLIGVKAGINNSLLNVSAWLTDSTILQPIRDTITIEKIDKTQTTTNTVEVKYIPKIYKYALWGMIILIVSAIGYVGIKLFVPRL